MKLSTTKLASISISLVSVYIVLFFLGCMLLLNGGLIVEVSNHNKVAEKLGYISYELGKALLLGCSVGVLLTYVHKNSSPDEYSKMLKSSGIANIYTSRDQLSQNLIELVNNSSITRINIIGISLHDFLLGGGGLKNVWHCIEERLLKEEQKKLSPESRLHVKLALLDPRSGEGLFRHSVEKDKIGKAGLTFDVPHGLEEIKITINSIYGFDSTRYLEARLYKHCPFCFLFITDTKLFVEQYYYRDHRKRVRLPVIQFESQSPQYKELSYSFETIWQNTKVTNFNDYETGSARGIYESCIRDIYLRDEVNNFGRFQQIVLQRGDNVRILAITGKYYLSHPIFERLRFISAPVKGQTSNNSSQESSPQVGASDQVGSSDQVNAGCQTKEDQSVVKFLIINPVSQQAILRAIADSNPHTQLRIALNNWSWETHIRTQLYQDVTRAVNELSRWIQKGHSFEVKLYSCSIACSLFMVNDHVFIEHYFYGRSQSYVEGLVLGGEYPTFHLNFEGKADNQKYIKQILENTFTVIWDEFSIQKVIDEQKLKEQFKINTEMLRRELN